MPGVCGEKVSKRVPVSFALVKSFLRRGRSMLVGDKVMLYRDMAVTGNSKRTIYSRVRVNVWVRCKKHIKHVSFVT